MKKNTSGQRVGVQMITAADGSAFTGSVTVAVTLDAGTQATGTVGSGACAHEGNGYHTYAPSQAETNGDLAAFTFTGTGAIPATVQVYTSFPQTGDSFARLGAPAGASTSADIAAVKAQTAAIETDTGTDLPATLATIAGYVDTEVAAIKAKTDQLTFTTANRVDTDAFNRLGAPAGASVSADVAAVKAETASIQSDTNDIQTRLPAALVGGRMSSQVGAMGVDVWDNSAVATSGAEEVATGLLDLSGAIETGLTVRQLLRAIGAVTFGDAAGLDAASGNATFDAAVTGAKVRVTAAKDGSSRTITLDLT